ncbi:MAG: tyrosine-type recombinase/integrase [Clostridia bacterium]
MTGSLRLKNGVYYAVLNYKDNYGKYKQKWISTGLKERGNKKEAQKFLNEQLETFKPSIYNEQQVEPNVKNDIIFMDYVKDFIESKKDELSPNVYKTYIFAWKILCKYFGDKLKLKDVTYHHLLDFYDYLKNERHNKNITVKHHAIILSPALRQAYRDDLIPKNPYEFMPKIHKEKPSKNYYNKEELENLFTYTDKTNIGLIVRIASYYGFRRSELIGLKWDAIDLLNKTITIKHKVLCVDSVFYCMDRLKTTASNRTLPLLPETEKLLLERKEQIEHNKKIYGMSYNKKYLDYVFVNDIGDLINPDLVSHTFTKILKQNNLKHIRFHDLRHSCASLLVANGVPMKNIQEWLGHSNFNTTADIYSHLDFSSKVQSANVISNALTKSEKKSDKEEDEIDEQNIEDEIAKLEKLLEEKRKRKKSKDAEM